MTTKPGLSSISPTVHPLTSPLSTTPGSPPTTPAWSSETSGSLMPSIVPPTSSGPTTPCLCHAFGKFFLPGDIVYNKTDGAGCPFLAICNQHCDLDRFQGTCPTSSPPGTSASVPSTTPVVGCDRTIPPRKVNESWFLEDCTVARCEGDNRIILLGPRPMNSITCVNGHLPVKVQNQSHPCDYHYECKCECPPLVPVDTSGGPPHPTGSTRVLKEGRRPLGLSDRQGGSSWQAWPPSRVPRSCPQILLNQTRVRQSFSKNGVTVTLTGATGMRVDIPSIGVSITFNGRVFQARLSYSRFNHNTEGQCGERELQDACGGGEGLAPPLWSSARLTPVCVPPDLACPPTKVYKSCGPVQPESCDSRSQSPLSVELAEGCFCPDGHILFNSHRDICVPECPCVGPDGLPKFPGEWWVSNCQDCVCDKGTVSVQCTPVECPAPDQPQECGRAGFMAVSRPLVDKPCCVETLCGETCTPVGGWKLVRTQVEDDCCPTFSCSPLLCTFNGTFYGVGATFPGVTPCHTCTCLSMDSEDPTVWCEEEACNTTCVQGFEYSTVAGQCCGECVQTTCLTPDGQLVQLNETWVNSLVDNCTEYHCQATDGPPMLTPTPVVCPDVSTCKVCVLDSG
ncbi:hypothetical protein G4228_001251 [Cervus hanglu yarkandensis]|nr:hypothetical protein G4228_001251 [Cervus hanglu yarkandensis]